MKHIPDQAEKLRQLAAQENSGAQPGDTAIATLDELAAELSQEPQPKHSSTKSALLADKPKPATAVKNNPQAEKSAASTDVSIDQPSKIKKSAVLDQTADSTLSGTTIQQPSIQKPSESDEEQVKKTESVPEKSREPQNKPESTIKEVPVSNITESAQVAKMTVSEEHGSNPVTESTEIQYATQEPKEETVTDLRIEEKTVVEENKSANQASLPSGKEKASVRELPKLSSQIELIAESANTTVQKDEITPNETKEEYEPESSLSEPDFQIQRELKKPKFPKTLEAIQEEKKSREPKTEQVADTPSSPITVETQPAKEEVKVQPAPSTVDNLFASRRFPMETNTQVIAITGGKGGVGKSNIACNLGLAITEMNKKVILLDADLSLANLDVLLGITPRFNLAHLINGEKTLQEIIIPGPKGISIIPGGSGIEELSNIPQEKMERVFDAFATLDPAPDVLIVDTAAGIHPNVIQFLMAADQTIVVTTPEPTAYTDAYALIKTIIKHDPQKELGVLINMVHNNAEAMEVLKLLLQICRQMLNITFNNIGYIPRDPAVLKAVRFQKPFILSSPNTLAAQSIRRIASTIMQIDRKESRTRGLAHFLRRLFTGYTPPSES